jgi:hypothetical protein
MHKFRDFMIEGLIGTDRREPRQEGGKIVPGKDLFYVIFIKSKSLVLPDGTIALGVIRPSLEIVICKQHQEPFVSGAPLPKIVTIEEVKQAGRFGDGYVVYVRTGLK